MGQAGERDGAGQEGCRLAVKRDARMRGRRRGGGGRGARTRRFPWQGEVRVVRSSLWFGGERQGLSLLRMSGGRGGRGRQGGGGRGGRVQHAAVRGGRAVTHFL